LAGYPPRHQQAEREREKNPQTPNIPDSFAVGHETWTNDPGQAIESQHETGGTETHAESHQGRQRQEATHLTFCQDTDGRQISNALDRIRHVR
jgi:hypothetical protein